MDPPEAGRASDTKAAALAGRDGFPYSARAMSSDVVPAAPEALVTLAPRVVAEPAASAESSVSHEVNAAGTQPRGVLRWGYFLVLNAIAGVIAVGLFLGLLYADGIDPYLRSTYEWLLAHPGVTSFIAFSPLASSLLVGWGYSQRAKKRKEAAARAAAAAEAAQAAKAATA